MLARPGEVHPDLAAAATLLASIVLLVDAYTIMRPSWTALGHEELRRGGLDLRLPLLTRLKGSAFLGLRLSLSGVIGTLVAVFVSLLLYGRDIAAQLAAEHALRTAPLVASATRQADERLARNVAVQAELRGHIVSTDQLAEGLRRGLLDQADPATSAAATELARMEAVSGRAEAELARQQRRADEPGLARARQRLVVATAERDAARARLPYCSPRATASPRSRASRRASLARCSSAWALAPIAAMPPYSPRLW